MDDVEGEAALDEMEAEEEERRAKRARLGSPYPDATEDEDTEAEDEAKLPAAYVSPSDSAPSSPTPPLTQDAVLDPIQRRAVDAALGGSNVFLTGGPGTGKSFTLLRIVDGLRAQNGADSVMVWAPTGIAALLVGGQTMQSKPGPGLATDSKAFGNMWGHKRFWRSVKSLVLDEVSMVDAEFLDWADATLRDIKAQERPY